MTHMILVAHGKLAIETKASGEMIYGQLPMVSAVAFSKEDGLDSLSLKIKEICDQQEGQLLILTDLFCGTPYNAGCKVAMEEPERQIEVLSGMSLPMLLEGVSRNATTAADLASIMKLASSEACRSFREQQIELEEEF
ncbi:PTS mannose/fructose/sorbose family IIA subunit [Vagococcus sp. BWB3-3]|uniref:PTS mannose/fructose/sorbose family IIA subunit n=1 Tax=Vagococcus allomyrinae TaxID=2794353 RepID=A0A940PBZ7_9ENTE|nr:PTS mannose/fructose/sorbose family IIA subunit [Vagococcus allomyrinae]MBP1040686.1 PTS mannose/fructose/sorbose family IIA subunit [Vagococcus allomyrinae]